MTTSEVPLAYEELGKRLKIIRRRRRLSQKRVAEALGWSPSRISRYEHANRCIDQESLNKLFQAYDVKVKDVFVNENEFVRFADSLLPLDFPILIKSREEEEDGLEG